MPAWLTRVDVVVAAGLAVFAASLATGAAATTMTEAGVSVADLQSAGTAAKAALAHDELGSEGREAAWWFLLFELPYLAGFGILLSAGCAVAAQRLSRTGPSSLAKAARLAVPAGFIAAACDLTQNIAVGAILLGHTGQPAPRIAQVGGYLTWVFGLTAGAVFVVGLLVSWQRRNPEPARPDSNP